jgi:phosphohistidine phosphatase SixA
MIGALLVLAFLRAPLAPADTGFTPTVVLVRHAEKASQTERDPGLSDLGRTRAAALDSALMDAHVTAIIVTQYVRTAETASLVAARHHLTPIVVAVDAGNLNAHIAAVVKAAREHDGVVLVIGHSNTVPKIVAALGGPILADLCDANYATMFTVVTALGKSSTMRSRYGATEPATADKCPGMVPR